MPQISIVSVDGKITHYLPKDKEVEMLQWLRDNGAIELTKNKGL